MRVRWMTGDTARSDALIVATGACVWCDVWCRGGGCDGVSCAAMCSVAMKGVAGRQGDQRRGRDRVGEMVESGVGVEGV